MVAQELKYGNGRRALGIALVAFVTLAVVTMLVWNNQIDRQKHLLSRHTEDVAFQASRRLQVFVESHLRMATVFARRWSTHETRDFSKKRFDEFAAVLIDELPGYYAITIVSPDNGHWTVPASVDHRQDIERLEQTGFLEQVVREGEIRLSEPVHSSAADVRFFAALPLQRDGELLGLLLIHFQAAPLMNDCFHEKIRSEFDFLVEDAQSPIYRFTPDGEQWLALHEPMQRKVTFALRNRQWVLTVVPQKKILADSGWVANLAVPALGFPLALLLSWLVWLLLRRMDLLRIARDRAVREVEERRRAEMALQASEARHAQLSRKVLMAQEDERARLSRELHDELGQILTALRLEIDMLAKSMTTPSGTNSELIDNAVSLVENSAEELRRICRGLRPPLLDDLGLEPALQTLTRDFAERTGISVDFDIDPEPNNDRVEPEIALAAYRIMQETLNNVSRHAATQSISASLFRTNEELQLSIEDHGVGFEPDALGPQNSCGLEGMRERAHLVEGTLSVVSSPGKGTRIVLRVPIKHAKGGMT